MIKQWPRLLLIILLGVALSGCKSALTRFVPGLDNETAQAPVSDGTVEPSSGGQDAAQIDSSGAVSSLGPGGGGAFDVFAFSPEYVFVGTDLGGVFRSANHGRTWETANRGLFDYMINDLAVDPAHPAVTYAATPGGLYRSRDNGDSWVLLRNGFPPKDSARYSAEIGTVAIDPLNADVIYAGVGSMHAQQLASGNGDLYRSTDGGASWMRFNIGDPAAALYKIVVDPIHDSNIYVASSTGFFKSTDRGQTWTKIDDMQSRGLVAGIDRKHSRVILYRTAWSAGVYKSEDEGATWQQLSMLHCPHSCEFYRIVLDPSDLQARKVFVGDYGDWNQDQGIFATSDGGVRWQQINTIADSGWIGSEQITRVRALGLNPYQPGELYYGNSMGIFRSQDQAKWQQVYTNGTASSGGESLPWPGQWQGRGSTDNTQANTRPMFDLSNHGRYYLGFSDLYIWGTTDNGATWENVQLPGDNDVRVLVADPNDGSFLTWFASSAAQECCLGALYKTTDGGKNWRRASGLPSDRILDIAISASDSDRVYAATLNNGLYMSTNGGVSFTGQNGVSGNSLSEGDIYRIAIDPRHDSTLYVSVGGHAGGIFKSADGGRTWIMTTDFTDCYALVISPINPEELFAGCGLKLYESKDSGTHWSMLFDAQNHPLVPDIPLQAGYVRDIALHPVDPNILCFVIKDDPYHDQASGGGLHCTLDGGVSWKEIASPLGLILRGTAVAFHPLADPATGDHDLFYMTGGNGAYRIPFSLLLKTMKGTP